MYCGQKQYYIKFKLGLCIVVKNNIISNSNLACVLWSKTILYQIQTWPVYCGQKQYYIKFKLGLCIVVKNNIISNSNLACVLWSKTILYQIQTWPVYCGQKQYYIKFNKFVYGELKLLNGNL